MILYSDPDYGYKESVVTTNAPRPSAPFAAININISTPMMPKKKGPPAPQRAVYNAGERRESCLKAIDLVKQIMEDSNDPSLILALAYLEAHRRTLESISPKQKP